VISDGGIGLGIGDRGAERGLFLRTESKKGNCLFIAPLRDGVDDRFCLLLIKSTVTSDTNQA
jgi:hypothetical protein